MSCSRSPGLGSFQKKRIRSSSSSSTRSVDKQEISGNFYFPEISGSSATDKGVAGLAQHPIRPFMPDMSHFFLTVILPLATLGSWVTTRLVLRLGATRDWIVQPSEARWHQKPVIGYGGVGFFPICLLFNLGWLVFVGPGAFAQKAVFPLSLPLALLIAGALLLASGILDDLKDLPPLFKLLIQTLSILVFVLAGGAADFSPFSSVNACLSIIWLLTVTNSLNLLDNADGLASGTAVLILTGLALLSFHPGETPPLGFFFSLILAASLAGFFLWNKPPASIFMGDTGSLPTGFMLAALSLPTTLNGHFRLAQIAPDPPAGFLFISLPCLAVPLFDTGFVMITRLIRRKNPLQGGTDHVSHRLVLLGLSHWQMLALMYLTTISGGGLSLFLRHYPTYTFPALLFCAAGFSFLGTVLYRSSQPLLVETETAFKT